MPIIEVWPAPGEAVAGLYDSLGLGLGAEGRAFLRPLVDVPEFRGGAELKALLSPFAGLAPEDRPFPAILPLLRGA